MTKRIENVTDIIDLEYLQSIQDSLGKIVGITTVLLDPQGVPVSSPTNLHAFCAMMQESETGLPMCLKANGSMMELNKETREPVVTTCPNSGLRTAAVPIFLGDQFLGSWLIGQIRMDDVDIDLIEQTSEKAGLSKEEAKANINILPVISEGGFNNVLEFLVTISKTLTDLVQMNDALNKRNAELETIAEKLDKSLMAFKSFIDFADMGTYLIDYYTGEVIMCNEHYKQQFGVAGQDITGVSCFSLMGFDDFCSFCPKSRLLDEEGNPTGPYSWENYLAFADRWMRVTSRVIPWVDDRLVIMTTFIDITDRKREEERIAFLAYNDQRLNIPNIVKLGEDLAVISEKSCMICFDVRGMRKINDVYGRDSGDNMLHSIVSWVHGLPDKGITLYRIEGGSFAILAEGYSEEKARALAVQICKRFDSSWSVEANGIQQNVYTGVHMGVFKAPSSLENLSDLLNIIERVLAFAREKSSLIVFDEEMNSDLEAHIQFEVELKECVLDNMRGFSLNYQPIVNVATEQWIGLEALCRWESARFGRIPPDVFIEEAEQLGLIDILSEWVLEEGIRQVKAWGLDTSPSFVLDINLSPLQLRDRGLLAKVLKVLEKYDYPARCLSLEITETSEVSFDDTTLNILESIRDANISLSLDDFGSGYATFSNLNNLPIDILKTDRSFVLGIEEDAFLQQTVRSMIDLSHAAGLVSVAEGVETEEQLAFMKEYGVDRIQGYYYSKPLDVETLSGMLDRFAGVS